MGSKSGERHERHQRSSRGERGRAAAALLLATTSGCAPMLSTYVEKLDPEGPLHARLHAPPEHVAPPACAEPLLIARFADERPEEERSDGGALAFQVVAGIGTLGLAPLFDRFAPHDIDQLLDGVGDELPRLLAERLVASGAAPQARSLARDRAALLDPLQRAAAGGGGARLLLAGTLRHFRGERETTDFGALQSHARHALDLELFDVTAGAGAPPLWSERVEFEAVEPQPPEFFRGQTRCTAANKVVVHDLGPFLARVERQLVAAFRRAPPAAAAAIAAAEVAEVAEVAAAPPPPIVAEERVAPSAPAGSFVLRGVVPQIAVSDLEASALWYRDYLGFTIEPSGDASFRRLHHGAVSLRLVASERVAADDALRFELESGGLARLRARLVAAAEARGTTFVALSDRSLDPFGDPLDDSNARLLVRDPDGRVLEFKEAAKR